MAYSYQIQRRGTGLKLNNGTKVTLRATGFAMKTGRRFWSGTFSYRIGVPGVAKGFASPPMAFVDGIRGMKLNELRKIMIPSAEGYKSKGFPAWGITGDSDLEFDVEVLQDFSQNH